MANNSIVKITYGQTATKPVFQWDYGQTLVFDGFGEMLPDVGFEVHFANPADETSVTSIGTADGVQIPDALLQTGLSVIVWVYLHDTATDGETEYRFTIPVARRAMPDNGEVTPEQADVIDQAIAALQVGVARSETAADNAEASETAAAASAAAAAGSASEAYSDSERAETAAGSAEGFAQSASESEGAAQGYATSAAASAAAASQSETSAAQSASAAQVSASAAIAAAQTAQNSESSASASASSAAASAASASQSATTAVAQATAAAASASAAGTSSDSAAASALSAGTSADSATASAASTEADRKRAEAWAAGTIDGTDVPSSDPAYDNNAKYWAEQARGSLADLREQFDAAALSARAYSDSDDGLFTFAQGTVQANGANLSSTTKGRSSFIALRTTPERIVMTDDTYSIWRVWTYGSRNALDGKRAIVSAVQDGTKDVIIVPREGENYFRVVCSYAEDSSHTMTAEDLAAISERFRVYNLTDKTLTGNGLPADASIVGEKFAEIPSTLIRGKNAESNTYAGLTMWSPAGAGFSSENPASPADMSTNAFCYTTGAVLAGFNNDVFDLVPSRYYWALCLRSQGNLNVRTYIVWASTNPEVYRGYTISGGDTVKWVRDNSSEYAQEAEELGLHSVPKSRGVINIIKRARQLTDVKWTPSVDMRGRVFSSVGSIDGAKKYLQGGFRAGIEYTGFPYSGTNWISEKFCPAQFLSGVACKVSRVSTFRPTKPTVHWDNGAYFGAVCSTLASYALGLPVTNAINFYKLFGLTYKGTIPEFDADQLALGDVLVAKSHVALVTDLIHDEDDHVTFVEVSEATSSGRSNYDDLYGQNGGLCKRKMYSIEAFVVKRDGYRVYSYKYADLIPYDQDPYTPVGSEGAFQPNINLPIIPETGDHCRVRTNSADASERTIRLVSNVFGTTDALGQSYPSPTHVYVERNGAAFNDGDHADGMYALSTQAADEEVVWNKSGSEHGRYTKVAGTQYVELVMPQGDEAVYTAKLAAYSNGAVNTFSDACEWLAYYGSAIVDVPDGVTEHVSSGMHYIDVSGGKHKFQLYRDTDAFDPVSVVYGDDLASGGGSLQNGRSTLVQGLVKEQTTITYPKSGGETRQVWKYTFEAVAPRIFTQSGEGTSIVSVTFHWRSAKYGGTFETYSASGASAYLGYSLYYLCLRTTEPENPFEGEDDDPSNQG